MEQHVPADMRPLVRMAVDAGDILLQYFQTDLDVSFKQDEYDPVTQADRESDTFLRNKIGELYPGDKILSEESEHQPKDFSGRVWMVDPLDGTKGFVAGHDTFAVLIGLLEDDLPTIGVSYAPARKELLFAKKGEGAYRVHDDGLVKLQVGSVVDLSDATLVGRHQIGNETRPLDGQVAALPVAKRVDEGSIGLKIGRIADATADVFVHTNTKGSKWDTLGPGLILTEAGGVMTDIEGNLLDYQQSTAAWQKYFVAASNQQLIEQVVERIKL